MSERKHAILSASGAARWLACTPSARLEETLPDSKSEYAAEGSLAHELAELKALKHTTLMKPSEYKKRLKKIQEHELYKPEMESCTEVYMDYIKKLLHSAAEKPYTAVEKKLDFTTYVPDGFGTGDFIAISGDTLYVIDYKHGQGVPVSAEDNPQMMLYGLGAYQAYSMLFDIQRIMMTIVQPRLDSISEFELSADALLYWGEHHVSPRAYKAHNGEGEFVSGDHCRFCRAKAQCRARADGYTALQDFGMMKPPLVSDEEVGELLIKGRGLAKWLSDLEEYALGVCLQGGEIAGWKAVPGRSIRAWTNQDEAFKMLKELGWNEAMLYEAKPLTLAGVEKLVGKKDFVDLLTPFVTTPPGKPTLVEANDNREAIKPITAEADFGKGEDF